MTEPDAGTMQAMADAAAGRARMWRLCGEIAARPTQDLGERLRDARVVDEIRESTRWLGEETPFDELLGALRAFANRSARYSLEDDMESLTAEWERLELGKDVPRVCARAASRADEEAAAWLDGDHVAAKERRLEQFRDMEMRLEPLSRWCQRADAETQVLVTRVLVRVVAAHTTVEGGRDLLGTLEQRGRTATFRF